MMSCVRSFQCGILVVLSMSWPALEASASTITWSFSGVADYVDDGLDLLDGTVSYGTPISGTFSFNSLAADRSSKPDIGSYQNWGQESVISLEATFGGHTLIVDPTPKPTLSSAGIQVFNDNQARYDTWRLKTFGLDATLDGAPVDLWFLDIGSGYSGRDISILDSDVLPVTPPAFPNYRFFMNLGEVMGTATRINGDVTLAVEAIPEPSAAIVFGVGTLVVGWATRRRSN